MDLKELKKVMEPMMEEISTKIVGTILDEKMKELGKVAVTPIAGGMTNNKTITGQYEKIGGGLVKTPQGSIIALNSARNGGRYWKVLSPEMEDFMKDLAKYLSSKGQIIGKSLNTISDTEGGFLVPEEFVASVIEYDTPQNMILPMATVVPMSSNKIKWPKLQQRVGTPTTANFFGGIVMTWAEDNASISETEPKFEDFVLETHKLSGLTKIDNSLLADSAINLANFITVLYRNAINYTLEDAMLAGNGVAKPLGIFVDPGINLVVRQQSNLVSFTDALALKTAVPSYLRGTNTVFLGSSEITQQLRDERDTNNALILRERYSEVGEGTFTTLMGHRYVEADGKLPSLGNKGDLSFGNWTHYWVGMRQDTSIASSSERYFEEDRTAMRVITRADGRAAHPKAFAVLDLPSSGS